MTGGQSQPNSHSVRFEVWDRRLGVELAEDAERQVRDDGHSIGVSVADGRLDFFRFSLLGK